MYLSNHVDHNLPTKRHLLIEMVSSQGFNFCSASPFFLHFEGLDRDRHPVSGMAKVGVPVLG
jgi:hypothetical protein